MATNKITRVLDCVEFASQGSGQTTAGTTFNVVDWGVINTARINLADDQRVVQGMSGGSEAHLPAHIVHLKHTPTGSLSFMPKSLTFLKYFAGDYADDGTDYTINNESIDLPTPLTIRGNINDSEALRLIGCYFNNLQLNLRDEDIVTSSCDIIGIEPEVVSATPTYDSGDVEPMTFISGVVTYNSVEFDLQEINLTLNPKFMQKWGITTKTTNKKRLPSQIIRGGKNDMSFNGIANLTADSTNQLETIWGGAYPPDETANVDLVLTFTHNSKTHTLTLEGKIGTPELNYSDSDENAKTISFSGVARKWSAGGEL